MADIPLPGDKRLRQVTYKNDFQFLHSEARAAFANFTPAQPGTIVDLAGTQSSIDKCSTAILAGVAEEQGRCTRHVSRMPGYRGDSAGTAEVIDSDGWMHSGDLATMDAQGYARIVAAFTMTVTGKAQKFEMRKTMEAPLAQARPPLP